MGFKMPWLDLRFMEQSHFQHHYLLVRNYILIRRKVNADLILGGSIWFLKQNKILLGVTWEREIFVCLFVCFKLCTYKGKDEGIVEKAKNASTSPLDFLYSGFT